MQVQGSIGAPLRGDLVGMSADVVGEDACRGQTLAKLIEHVMRGEVRALRPQRFVKVTAVVLEFRSGPGVVVGRQRRELGYGRIEVARGVECEIELAALHRLRADVHDGRIAGPLFEVNLHRVVADGDDEVGLRYEASDVGATGAAEDAGVVGVAFGQETLGMQGEDERQVLRFDEIDEAAVQAGPGQLEAADEERAPACGQQIANLVEDFGRDRPVRQRRRRRDGSVYGKRQRHVFRQIEMNRAGWLLRGELNRRAQRLKDFARTQGDRVFGERLKELVVVDAHLDTAVEHCRVDVAGDGDEWRAVEPGGADAGCEVGGAWAERGYGDAGHAGHGADGLGHEAGRGFTGCEDELDLAVVQRFDQRQDGAGRHAEGPLHAGTLQRLDNELGVVHVARALRFRTTSLWPRWWPLRPPARLAWDRQSARPRSPRRLRGSHGRYS